MFDRSAEQEQLAGCKLLSLGVAVVCRGKDCCSVWLEVIGRSAATADDAVFLRQGRGRLLTRVRYENFYWGYACLLLCTGSNSV